MGLEARRDGRREGGGGLDKERGGIGEESARARAAGFGTQNRDRAWWVDSEQGQGLGGRREGRAEGTWRERVRCNHAPTHTCKHTCLHMAHLSTQPPV